jgi:formamidopyrimidine-DNA glycosylase
MASGAQPALVSGMARVHPEQEDGPMPESPEVEVLARHVRERAEGRRIAALELEEFRVLKTRDRRTDDLAGATVSSVARHGKHLSLATDGPALVVSFGRAGWMRDLPSTVPAPDGASATGAVEAAPVARLLFDDGTGFVFTDAGEWLSFGLSIVGAPSEVPSVAKLGPDPLTGAFTRDDLARITSGRRKQLKALLQEQESVAGIGNAYSDEILHVARLSPLMHAAALTTDELARLYDAIRVVLSGALSARAGVPVDQLKAHKVASMRVHGRTGEACLVCGGEVADIPGSKGSGQYCPVCQGQA